VSKSLGETLPIEQSDNFETKAIERAEGNMSVVSPDSALTRPLRKSFSEGVTIFVLRNIDLTYSNILV